jgi:tetratricopeptide (TPR) repeat protein
MKSLIIACCAWLSVSVVASGTCRAANPLGEARSLFKAKQYDRAAAVLGPALEGLRGADLDEGLLLLAALETRPERAIALYQRVISAGSERAALRAVLELSQIYYARGEYRTALEVLSPSDRGLVRRDPAASYVRGLCYRQLKENARARAEFTSVDRGPYLLWSTLALAEIDAEEGSVAKAVERYETIGGKFSNPIASFKLGECYETLGQREKSLDTYRALVATFPRSLEASQGREKIVRLSQLKEEPAPVPVPKGGEAGTTIGGEGDAGAASEQGYTIQFGAFTERENAIRMARQIETLIADVRVESIQRDNRTLHRVRAGSYTDREAAERAAAAVRQRLGFTGTIVPLR